MSIIVDLPFDDELEMARVAVAGVARDISSLLARLPSARVLVRIVRFSPADTPCVERECVNVKRGVWLAFADYVPHQEDWLRAEYVWRPREKPGFRICFEVY